MGGIVVGCFCAGLIAWAMDSPAFEWLRNLFWRSEPQGIDAEPFVVSEYFVRIEKASLEILESRKPVEQIVILWWGLDGLRLNEDGATEWISRKKSEPVSTSALYQPCRSITPTPQYDMCQSTQAQIDDLMAQNTMLNLQAAQAAQNMMIANSLSGMIQTPVTYPLYHYAGCCCNFLG